MTLQVTCPNPVCSNHHAPKQVEDRLAGKRTQCKKCGTIFVINESCSPGSPGPTAAEVSWGRVAVVVGGFLAVLLVLVGIGVVLVLQTSSPGADDPEKEPLVKGKQDTVTPPPKKGNTDALALAPGTGPQQPGQPEQNPRVGPAPTNPPTPPGPGTPTVPPTTPEVAQNTGQPQPPPRADPPTNHPEQGRLVPIEALGPIEKLDKIKVVQIKGKATFANSNFVTELELAWHGLTHFRADEFFGEKRFKIVLKDDSGFRMGQPIPREQLFLLRNEAYSYSLSNLTPLKDKRFEIKPLEDATVQGKNCMVVEAALTGRPPIKMYFAKDTRLLVKSEFESVRDRKMVFANHYSDYRETDGVKHWRKLEQFRDGRKYASLEVHTVRFLEDFDSKMFEP